MKGRPRVLLIAESANPEWASVPLVGWSHARALFEVADAHLVTQVRNVEAIERAGFRLGKEFTALDSESVARPLWKAMAAVQRWTGLGWSFTTAVQALAYYYFERLFWRRFGAEIEAGRWDVVHRLTPLSPTTPSIIVRRCRRAGVPFVLGPINGGLPWPPGFAETQHQEGEWLHALRGAYRLMPGYGQTYRHAAAILAGSGATLAQLPKSAQGRAVYLPENGIDERRFELPPASPVRTPLGVAFVGRLVPYKGVDMLIEAAADLVRSGQVVLDVIGDGPERAALAALVARLGLGGGVKLDGWVEHRDLAARLLRSDVLGFPSVREFGGAVVLEAMALGLVPIVADYGGPAEHVTGATGHRVPMGSRAALVDGTRRALEALVRHPGGVRAMGARARQRVLRSYTWSVKARQVLEVYRWVRGERDKPDFGMPLAEPEGPEAAGARSLGGDGADGVPLGRGVGGDVGGEAPGAVAVPA